MLRKGRGVETERRRADGGQTPFAAGKRDIIAIKMTAVFLRADVILMQIRDGGTPDAVTVRLMFVGVALKGTVAVIADLIERVRKEKPKSEARQFRKFRIARNMRFHGQRAVSEYRPRRFHMEKALQTDGAQRRGTVNDNAFVRRRPRRLIRSRYASVIMRGQPFEFDFPVVVGRGAPDVPFHRLIQPFRAVEGHMVKQSCALVVDITETVIPNRQELLAFRDNQRARFGAIRFEERGGGLI